MVQQQQIPLELSLLINALDREFGALIVGSGNNSDACRSNFLSKAVAAFVLVQEAGASPEAAASASVDGGGDHGIDSVYIGSDDSLWLIQSKYSTVVNDGMQETLRQEASHFFYFNNGVTFLCEQIQQRPPIHTTREKGRFKVRGISIINGAQTVGAISAQHPDYFDEHPAEVLATFVSLEQAPVEFGARVTQYRNRQNAVDLEDFAALDERQEAWRKTLTARELWRVVQISRIVQKTIKDRAKGEPDTDAKEILRQGQWLVLHILFIKTQLRWGGDLILTQIDIDRLSVAIDAIANALVNSARSTTWGRQYRSVFANQTDCKTIRNLMMAALTQPL